MIDGWRSMMGHKTFWQAVAAAIPDALSHWVEPASSDELLPASEWQKRLPEIVVMDPDGWRHKNDGVTWETPITEAEYIRRRAQCTTGPREAFVPRRDFHEACLDPKHADEITRLRAETAAVYNRGVSTERVDARDTAYEILLAHGLRPSDAFSVAEKIKQARVAQQADVVECDAEADGERLCHHLAVQNGKCHYHAAATVRRCHRCCERPAYRETITKRAMWPALCRECLDIEHPEGDYMRGDYYEPDGRLVSPRLSQPPTSTDSAEAQQPEAISDRTSVFRCGEHDVYASYCSDCLAAAHARGVAEECERICKLLEERGHVILPTLIRGTRSR